MRIALQSFYAILQSCEPPHRLCAFIKLTRSCHCMDNFHRMSPDGFRLFEPEHFYLLGGALDASRFAPECFRAVEQRVSMKARSARLMRRLVTIRVLESRLLAPGILARILESSATHLSIVID